MEVVVVAVTRRPATTRVRKAKMEPITALGAAKVTTTTGAMARKKATEITIDRIDSQGVSCKILRIRAEALEEEGLIIIVVAAVIDSEINKARVVHKQIMAPVETKVTSTKIKVLKISQAVTKNVTIAVTEATTTEMLTTLKEVALIGTKVDHRTTNPNRTLRWRLLDMATIPQMLKIKVLSAHIQITNDNKS